MNNYLANMYHIILIREQNYSNYSNSFPEIIAKGDSLIVAIIREINDNS